MPLPPRIRRRRTPLVAALAVCAAVTVSACGSSSPAAKKSPTAKASARSSEDVTTPGASGTPRVLTFSAPVVVQVDNTIDARPLSGLSLATVVYEYVAEGGISRLSAVYTTPPPGLVGPVRSARLATVQIAKNLHAVLAHSGASTYILSQLAAAKVYQYDEDTSSGNLFRISTREAPHNLYTDGAHLASLVSTSGAPAQSSPYWPQRSAQTAGGRPSQSVTVNVSPSEIPTFQWDHEHNGYVDHELDGGIITDANTNAPVVMGTVIVQQVLVAPAPQVVDVNGVTGFSHNLAGSGAAQVFTGDQEYDATWTQPETGPPQFTLAGGAPAPINTGLVWIVLVPVGQIAHFH